MEKSQAVKDSLYDRPSQSSDSKKHTAQNKVFPKKTNLKQSNPKKTSFVAFKVSFAKAATVHGCLPKGNNL